MLVSTYVVVVAINHYNLTSFLVFLCPFPRMLFGDPRIVFIVIPSFLCISVQSVVPHTPERPMCCFGRNSCWLKLFKLFFF